MKVPTVAPTAINELPSTRGIDVVLLPSEGNDSFSLQLTSKDRNLNQIFDVLVTDVAEFVASAQTEIAAIKAFINRLRRWQRFLEQTGPDGLSKASQLGLFGELWFLREKLIPLVGTYVAVSAWTGPSGAHQDFQLYECAIEVKTTGTKEPQQMIIQSERQLEDSSLAALFLQHLSLNVNEKVGETLIMMVDSLRQLFKRDTEALELYENKLLEAGFLQSQALKYEKTRYSINRASLFKVEKSFPRIITADLKPGVGLVQYSIAVSECRHFTATQDELKYQLIGI
jgi:hypothetical protein